MGEFSKISWTDSTHNHWRGCTKVSEGCRHCYAERDSKRNPAVLGTWGPEPDGKRIVATKSTRQKPFRWQAEAERTGRRHLVFTASLSDVFEEWNGPIVDHFGQTVFVNPLVPSLNRPANMDDVRLELFDTIRRTPHLTWLVLTKRIDKVMDTLHRCYHLSPIDSEMSLWLLMWIEGHPPENAWLGTSVEDQQTADARLDELLKIPNTLPWVSYEPALGGVDFRRWIAPMCSECGHSQAFRRKDGTCAAVGADSPWGNRCHRDGIGWMICGGESGPQARPFDLAWARQTRDQCKAAGVPFFLKQLGAKPWGMWDARSSQDDIEQYGLRVLTHRSGADPSEWPGDLRVQEFPR